MELDLYPQKATDIRVIHFEQTDDFAKNRSMDRLEDEKKEGSSFV
jgi:hypothetical protein